MKSQGAHHEQQKIDAADNQRSTSIRLRSDFTPNDRVIPNRTNLSRSGGNLRVHQHLAGLRIDQLLIVGRNLIGMFGLLREEVMGEILVRIRNGRDAGSGASALLRFPRQAGLNGLFAPGIFLGSGSDTDLSRGVPDTHKRDRQKIDQEGNHRQRRDRGVNLGKEGGTAGDDHRFHRREDPQPGTHRLGDGPRGIAKPPGAKDPVTGHLPETEPKDKDQNRRGDRLKGLLTPKGDAAPDTAAGEHPKKSHQQPLDDLGVGDPA